MFIFFFKNSFQDTTYIIGTEFKTRGYSNHYQAYEVEKSSHTIVFNIKSLKNFHPLCLYKCLDKKNTVNIRKQRHGVMTQIGL
jgi:hypothetical protein